MTKTNNPTVYEDLTNRMEILKQAALRCANNDNRPMMWIWQAHAEKLRVKRDELTIGQAGMKK